MITYVDTSTLIKLVIEEDGSDRAALIWDAADSLASATLIVVESHAALAAATRDGRLSTDQHRRARAGVRSMIGALHLAEVTTDLIARAAGLAESEALHGYDAVHLAAALHLDARILTSADAALCDAAARHGMHVANPLAG